MFPGKCLANMLPLLVESLQFNVCSVADHCFGSKLISQKTYDTISEINATTSADKTRVLLRNVISNISLDASRLEDFVAVLKTMNDCQLLVEQLQKITIWRWVWSQNKVAIRLMSEASDTLSYLTNGTQRHMLLMQACNTLRELSTCKQSRKLETRVSLERQVAVHC